MLFCQLTKWASEVPNCIRSFRFPRFLHFMCGSVSSQGWRISIHVRSYCPWKSHNSICLCSWSLASNHRLYVPQAISTFVSQIIFLRIGQLLLKKKTLFIFFLFKGISNDLEASHCGDICNERTYFQKSLLRIASKLASKSPISVRFCSIQTLHTSRKKQPTIHNFTWTTDVSFVHYNFLVDISYPTINN